MKTAQMILDYLHTHPTSYAKVARGLQNVVAFRLPDTIIFPYQHHLFPDERLEATRMEDGFIQAHPALVQWLAKQIDEDEPPVPNELWLTLSHVSKLGLNFVEVSFE